MKVTTTIPETREIIESIRANDQTIALVPTMGSLHDGHLSLISEAKSTNTFIVVSIFVNPTQFNDPLDLKSYPRDLKRDLERLKHTDADLAFTPSVEEIYPEQDKRIFKLDPLDTVMEGAFRPGHFNGVAQIVSKLFNIINPHKAYFGTKDFQQLAIIKKLVEIIDLDIEIIGCPIIRENDGLAMSSRNQLLSNEEREAAPHIYKTLAWAKSQTNQLSPEQLKNKVHDKIKNHPMFQMEYFEIVNAKDLSAVHSWRNDENIVGCIAVKLGKVRLIDNIYFT